MSESTFDIIPVEDGIWRIESDMVRAWLFTGTEKALLVDTTNTPGDLMAVIRSVTNLPVMLVNTHADPDHITCNDRFKEAFMHPLEFALYKQKAADGYAAPRCILEGDRVDLGGRVFEVLHIPGHTPGSIALLDRENRLLVSGDTISDGPVFMFGAHRNIPDFLRTLQYLQKISGDFDRILTSHGGYSAGVSQIENERLCLEECLAGNVEAQEPPFPLPAKMYCSHGAGFFLDL